MKKYLVIAGKVISKFDGDLHKISCIQLCRLYKVNLNDCIFADEGTPAGVSGLDLLKFEKILRPQYDGNCTI